MPVHSLSPPHIPTVCALAALTLSACGNAEGSPHVSPVAAAPRGQLTLAQGNEFEVPPPPFSEGIFPCSDCHDPEGLVRVRRRELKFAHQEIVLRHDEENRWCLDCHDTYDRDQLHLVNGSLVPFEESYRLCGQCHGDKYRDWRAGVHGRRTGNWNGERQYLLCVHCHDSHHPAFEPLEPLPPPPKPRRTR